MIKKIYDVCYLTGMFKLRSGLTSHEYFDKYMFESDPVLLKYITQEMALKIPKETEILAGLEMGGIPLVTMLSSITGLPAVFVRKQAKIYGTAKFVEGPDIKGKNVLIIEDVVTTGGQIRKSVTDMRALGAVIANVLCVIDREQGGTESLLDCELILDSLYKKSDF